MPNDGCHEDRSPQPSLVDRDRLASLRNDLLKRGTFNNRVSPAAGPPPDDAPILQARVSIPDSAPDRRQWLKQQSSSRRRRRRSSKSPARSPRESRGRRPSSALTGPDSRSSSRDSSLGGGESDASSTSVNSRLSIASTPEASGRQRQLERHQQHRRYGSSERTGSAGPRDDRSRRSSKGSSGDSRGLSPSMLSSARGGGKTGGSLSRNSSSSSLSSAVSSSSLGSLSLRWCAACDAEFTPLRRPHRCRRCLEAVCAPCSPARVPVPGSGSVELKRTCKLCAGRSARPQVDVVVSPRRPKKVASPAGGPQRRAASMGSMIRAPLGVFSGVAAAVKYTAGLYPAASSSGAVNGDEDAGKARSGGSDAGVGGGCGENGGAAGRSSNDQGYFPTRIATGGLAALGRWRAGMAMSTEKPSEEPSASSPAAGARGDQAKAPTPGDEDGAKASSVAEADVAVEPSSEAGEELLKASTPPGGGGEDEAKVSAPEDGAGVGAARRGMGVESPPEAVKELSTAPSPPAAAAEIAEGESPAGEADVGAAWPDVAEPFARVANEPSPASTPAVVAGALATASADEAAEPLPVVAVESPQASTRAVGAEVAEAKALQMESEAGVRVAGTGAADPSAGAGEQASTVPAIEDAWTMVDGGMAEEAPIETVSHAADTQPTVPDEPEAVPGGGLSWRGARGAVAPRRTASAAALEEKFGDASGVAATEGKPSARSVTTVQAAQGTERTLSEPAMGDAATSSPGEVAPSSPLRRALRFVRRLVRPRFERLREGYDCPPHHCKESVADVVPVLKAGSPIALECCAAFGIDAAGWMQAAKYASESYRVVEEQAKKRLARRRARR